MSISAFELGRMIKLAAAMTLPGQAPSLGAQPPPPLPAGGLPNTMAAGPAPTGMNMGQKSGLPPVQPSTAPAARLAAPRPQTPQSIQPGSVASRPAGRGLVGSSRRAVEQGKGALGKGWNQTGGKAWQATAGRVASRLPWVGPAAQAATNYGMAEYGVPNAVNQAFGGEGFIEPDYSADDGNFNHSITGSLTAQPLLRYGANKVAPNSTVAKLLQNGPAGKKLKTDVVEGAIKRVAPKLVQKGTQEGTEAATKGVTRRMLGALGRKGGQIGIGAAGKATGPLATPINAGLEALDGVGLLGESLGGTGWGTPGWADRAGEGGFDAATSSDGTFGGQDLVNDWGFNQDAADAVSQLGGSLNAFNKPVRSTYEVAKEGLTSPAEAYQGLTDKNHSYDRSSSATGMMLGNAKKTRESNQATAKLREDNPEMYQRMDDTNETAAKRTADYYRNIGAEQPQPKGERADYDLADHVAQAPQDVYNAAGEAKDSVKGWFGY